MTITLNSEKYAAYCAVLREELVPAMGCTEPIAIAYAAAKAREVLGTSPESCSIAVSGNIIKNAKSVVVPHTDGMRGIEAAVVAGIVAGNASAMLEVLSFVTADDIEKMKALVKELPIKLSVSDDENAFDIAITLYGGGNEAFVRILGRHTNVVSVKKNGITLFEGEADEAAKRVHAQLTVEEIVEFADTVDIKDVQEVLDRQISYNMAIAEEGLRGSWGASIGQVYLSSYASDISIKAKAYAAAGSDARMNGCELPVIINSGSGNQGMTASIPVIVYWQELGLDKDKLYRALCVSNLITVHIKQGIGTLSAYCGAVAAGAAAGAGIAYLYGGGFREVAHTLVNALAIDSGLICDGAKASCAAKIATAVENGILGFNLFRAGKQFVGGDGIVKKGVENTIENVCRLARDGMKDTDREILSIMVE